MMDPQLISPSSSGLNGKTDLPSQKVLKTASNDSASKPQVKTRLDCHYPIELDDDDVICLGEVASAVIDLDLNDSSTHRCDNHATVKTQSSPVVSKEMQLNQRPEKLNFLFSLKLLGKHK